jgi:hypothetical protein
MFDEIDSIKCLGYVAKNGENKVNYTIPKDKQHRFI